MFRPKLIAFLLSAAATFAGAANDELRLSASLVGGAVYPPGRWLAVNATLTNNSAKDIDGTVSIDPGKGAGMLATERAVRVPAHSSLSVELLTRFGDEVQDPKKKKAAELAAVTWRDSNGRPVVQEPMGGLSDASIARDGHDPTGVPGVTLAAVSDRNTSDDRLDSSELGPLLSSRSSFGFDTVSMDAQVFPRHVEGLEAVRLIAIDPAVLESLDIAQRQAILSAARSGATILLTQPSPLAARSWLGQYVPLDVAGKYRTAALHPKQYEALPLQKPAVIADCTVRDGATVTAADDRGPLAAFAPIGFGRVVMTAFDVNDLAQTPTAAQLWFDVLGVDQPYFHDSSALTDKPPAAAVLPAMIGATAPPWRLAAIVVGGYVLVVAVLLLVAGPVRRPVAMVGCIGVSVLVTGALLGFTALKSSGTPLMVGRLTTLDVAGNSATQTDLVTFFGRQRNDLTFDLPAGATASAVVANSEATLSLWPTQMTRVASSSGKLETVWQVRRTLSTPGTLGAVLHFGPNGTTLATENALNQPLQSTRLILGGNVIPMNPIAAGKSEQPVGPRNPSGVFTDSAAVLANEQSKLRTQFVELVSSDHSPAMYSVMPVKKLPVLTGFIDSEPTLHFAEAGQSQAQTLVRIPLTLAATDVGSEVRVDPAFIAIRTGASMQSLPYSAATTMWTESNLTGSNLFAVAAPRDIGRLRPRTLTLDLDVRATGYHLTLSRGQCTGGKVHENPRGDVIAEWNNEAGVKKVTIDVADADIDANGWVWLRLNLENVATTTLMGDAVQGNWQFLRFNATLAGKIDGPPQTDIATWPPPEPVIHAAPSKTPPKAPAKPKPTTKPTTKPAKPAAKPPVKK